MRALRLAVTLTAVACLFASPASASAPSRHQVAVFYYPWYGNPASDGEYQMWLQNDHAPPKDIYSAYFPARGAYSSSNARLIEEQMREIKQAGIDVVITSWWGEGSPTDQRLPAVLRAARRQHLSVAAHIEPYEGRTAISVGSDVAYLAGLGIHDIYVFNPLTILSGDWAAVRPTLPPVRLFAQTSLPGFAAAAGFDGIYTYDIVTWGASKFARICAQAHALKLLCAPSVGPGYDATRADGDAQLKARRDGATYDNMWHSAVDTSADIVTITSYNEWGEGTQIEPARPAAGYQSYEGAWGQHGAAAADAYLARTAGWTRVFHSRR